MLHLTPYIKDFMALFHYPAEAVALFTETERRLDAEPAFAEAFDAHFNSYMLEDTESLADALAGMDALAADMGLSPYTLAFVFVMNCTEPLREKYAAAGIEEAVFWQGCDDLRCKLLECMACKGVPGTFVANWNHGFLKMDRFAYGRFQYEIREYIDPAPYTFSCGKTIARGETLINFHIPSSGIPLTDDVRLASYREAYPHYRRLFPDGLVVFGCTSWLLYPIHREFLPATSNILRFMDDFHILRYETKDPFSNAWRIFGRDADLPPAELPRDTSLRKAYADWLQAGNLAGDAFGLFAFDGEKLYQ